MILIICQNSVTRCLLQKWFIPLQRLYVYQSSKTRKSYSKLQGVTLTYLDDRLDIGLLCNISLTWNLDLINILLTFRCIHWRRLYFRIASNYMIVWGCSHKVVLGFHIELLYQFLDSSFHKIALWRNLCSFFWRATIYDISSQIDFQLNWKHHQ